MLHGRVPSFKRSNECCRRFYLSWPSYHSYLGCEPLQDIPHRRVVPPAHGFSLTNAVAARGVVISFRVSV